MKAHLHGTVGNRVGGLLTALLLAGITGGYPVLADENPINNNVTWSGGGGSTTQGWQYGVNWSAGRPPANPHTVGTLTFGAAANNSTSVVDPRVLSGGTWGDPTNTWRVNNLTYAGGSNKFHLIDCGSNTLSVTGTLSVNGASTGYSMLRIRNGTLGTLGNVTVGHTYGGYLDLRLLNPSGGAIVMNSLTNGYNCSWQWSGIYFDSGIKTFQVRGAALFCYGPSYVRFGSASSPYALPPGTSLIFGVPPVSGVGGSRGSLRLGHGVNRVANNLYIGAPPANPGEDAGTFTAYLSDLKIAHNETPWENFDHVPMQAILDLTNMASCSLDVLNVNVGDASTAYNTSPNQQWAIGHVRLPAGTFVARNVTVGDNRASLGSEGRILLNGTHMTVTNSLKIDTTGLLTANIGATSCGLRLSNGVALTLTAGGQRIKLIFTARPTSVSQGHYGLCWEGNHLATLEGYVASGVISASWKSGVEPSGEIVPFLHQGNTYLGLPPPPGTMVIVR